MSRRAARVAPLLALAVAACAWWRGADRPAGEPPTGMSWIDGGTFQLGLRTGPAHDAVDWERVRGFLLDAHEVTVAAYGECVRAGRCAPAAAPNSDAEGGASRGEWAALCNGDRADRADHPVNCVDWGQAAAYCAWAGKRLPSEAEWEWAARNGGAGTAFPWGADAPAARPCWSGAGNDAAPEKRAGTCAAGSHPDDGSRSGVKDLAGDVREWTSSWSAVGADSRGRGGSAVRVVRGGSWADAEPQRLTAWWRGEEDPSRRDPRLGFRCARDP